MNRWNDQHQQLCCLYSRETCSFKFIHACLLVLNERYTFSRSHFARVFAIHWKSWIAFGSDDKRSTRLFSTISSLMGAATMNDSTTYLAWMRRASFERAVILENRFRITMFGRAWLCRRFHGTNSFKRVVEREWAALVTVMISRGWFCGSSGRLCPPARFTPWCRYTFYEIVIEKPE